MNTKTRLLRRGACPELVSGASRNDNKSVTLNLFQGLSFIMTSTNTDAEMSSGNDPSQTA